MVDKSLYPFKSNFFSPNGLNQMNYVDVGTGVPMVMVHGNPTWSFFYRNLALLFKKKYRIIIPDHMGMGLSDKPKKYQFTIKNHMENFGKLIDSLELPPFHLVVHDWGGPIGLSYAVSHPEKIKSLTILNTAAFNSKEIPFRIALCKFPLLGRIIIQGFNGFAYPATLMASHKGLSREVKKGFLHPYKKLTSRAAQWKFVQEIPLKPNHPNFNLIDSIEKKLHLLKCKKLILWGEKDFCFNQSFLKRWREIYPEANVISYQNAGHYLLEDAIWQIFPEMENFLEKS
ncbi:MAG: alpha/beta fold hydrolase [Bacteriovoracales bacterium]